MVSVWRAKPCRLDVERDVSILKLGVVENGVAYTRKKIGFFVYCLA
jgi:hypothetical protein